MTNLQRQKQLDKAKWLESESFKTDLSGNMGHCDYCEFQNNFHCPISQLDREMNCICAKSYNKMTKEKAKK